MALLNSSQNEKFFYKCDRHAANVSEKLLSYYEDNEFFDTVLMAGSDSVAIEAHRIVLSALSEYFFQIFLEGKTASKGHVVELKELEAPTLKLVIDFMYSGGIELSLETVENILKTAAFLKIKTLVDDCSDFIETHITSTNCLKWLRLAKILNLSGLKEKSLKCTYTHFEKISKEKEFMLLSEEELKDLLFNDNPYGDFEEHVFLAVVAWIKYDKINREELTFELFSMVRYQFLTPKFIVGNRKSVCQNVASYELTCSWLQWLLSPETRPDDHQNTVFKTRKEAKLTAFSYSDYNEVTMQTYNPIVDSWSIEKETTFCNSKLRSSMIVIDEKLIVVGGQNNGKATNSVECLDLHTFKWSHLPSMQEARYWSQLENVNGNLCFFGGYDTNLVFVNSLEMYNFSTCNRNSLEPLFKPSDFARMISHNGILHIVDFYNGCLQSFDISSNQCVSKEIVQKELKWFGLAAVDRYLFVLGGIYQNAYINTVSRYDLSNDTWCEVAPLKMCRSAPNTFVFENKIYVCGGFPENNANLVEEYNPGANTWTILNLLLSDINPFAISLCKL